MRNCLHCIIRILVAILYTLMIPGYYCTCITAQLHLHAQRDIPVGRLVASLDASHRDLVDSSNVPIVEIIFVIPEDTMSHNKSHL